MELIKELIKAVEHKTGEKILYAKVNTNELIFFMKTTDPDNTKNELEKFARKSLSEHRYNLSINTIDEDMAFIFGFYQGAKLWINYDENKDLFEKIINEDGDCLLKYSNGSIKRFLEGFYKFSEGTHFKRLI